MEITLKPTSKQHEVYQALENPKIKTIFFGGGAGGGKSWTICESRLVRALRFPGYKSYIGREELKRLMQSTYQTWVKVCKYHKVPEDSWKLNGQYNYIEFKNGSRIDLLDLKYLPTDPLFERFGSLEFTDGAIEEAGEVHVMAYDVLKSRVNRHMNKEFGLHASTLITGNPKKNWTYTEFYKPWKEDRLPEGSVFIQSLYSDNPYTADTYGESLADLSNEQLKQRLLFGNWEYDDDPMKLFSYDPLIDMFTNTVVSDNTKFVTADIARFGDDKTVIGYWEGLTLKQIEKIESSSLVVVKDTIRKMAEDYRVPYSHVIADEDGVGGGVIDMLGGIKGFMGNMSPFEIWSHKEARLVKANYRNLRTQCYFKLADVVNNHQLRIEDDRYKDEIVSELEVVKQKETNDDQKIQLIAKDDIKMTLGRSPDFADMLMMRMYFELDSGNYNDHSPVRKRELYLRRQRNTLTKTR